MKEEMEKLNLYTIDIAHNPGEAIKKLCDPILNKLNDKVEDCEVKLRQNMIFR